MLYQCHNEYGKLIAEIDLDIENLERVVIEIDGILYSPINYCLFGHCVAQCVPVKLIKGNDNSSLRRI